MMKEGNKIILIHSVIVKAMKISLSAGKGWFLFFQIHLYAVSAIFFFKEHRIQ